MTMSSLSMPHSDAKAAASRYVRCPIAGMYETLHHAVYVGVCISIYIVDIYIYNISWPVSWYCHLPGAVKVRVCRVECHDIYRVHA